MTIDSLDRDRALLVRAGSHLCAIPLAYVVEVMRPLNIEKVGGVPPFVQGLSIIRGEAVPVVDLGVLTGDGGHGVRTRFVTLQIGDRRVALAVDVVLGVCTLDGQMLQELPPLLRDAGAERVQAIGILDAQLLIALNASQLIPEEVWQALAIR